MNAPERRVGTGATCDLVSLVTHDCDDHVALGRMASGSYRLCIVDDLLLAAEPDPTARTLRGASPGPDEDNDRRRS